MIQLNTIKYFSNKNISEDYYCDKAGNVYSKNGTVVDKRWIELDDIVVNILSYYMLKDSKTEGYNRWQIDVKDVDGNKVRLRRSHIVYFANNPSQERLEGYEIDHINRNSEMDVIFNLRYITKLENMRNRSMHNYLPDRSKVMKPLDLSKPMARNTFVYNCKQRGLNESDFTSEEAPREFWGASKRDGYVKKYYYKVK